MNNVCLIGRLTADPDVSTKGKGKNAEITAARYTLAVDRPFAKKNDEVTADFIRCVAFGKGAEFVNNYLEKGMKIAVVGRIQTSTWEDKDGDMKYSTDVVVSSHDFCEKKEQ